MSELTQWLLAAAAVALGASIQGATGFGFAVLSIPLLSLIYDPHTAVILGLCLSVVSSSMMVVRLRAQVDWRALARWVAYGAAGLPVGVWIFGALDPGRLKLLIAVVVGLLAIVLLRGVTLRTRYLGRAEFVAALTAGTLATSVGMPGPPMVLFVSVAAYEKARFRATLSSFGFVTSLLSVGALALAGSVSLRVLGLAGTLSVGIVGGLMLGAFVQRGFDQRQFNRAVLVILLVLAGVTAFGAR